MRGALITWKLICNWLRLLWDPHWGEGEEGAHCTLPFFSISELKKIFICGFVIVAGFIFFLRKFDEYVWHILLFFSCVVLLLLFSSLFFAGGAADKALRRDAHTQTQSRTHNSQNNPTDTDTDSRHTVSGPGTASCHRHSLLLYVYWSMLGKSPPPPSGRARARAGQSSGVRPQRHQQSFFRCK